jgi:hypothetical protein
LHGSINLDIADHGGVSHSLLLRYFDGFYKPATQLP